MLVRVLMGFVFRRQRKEHGNNRVKLNKLSVELVRGLHIATAMAAAVSVVVIGTKGRVD